MRRVFQGLLIGAVVAGCLASVDGAILGALVAGGTDVALTAGRWAVAFAAIGAVVGGIIGGLCGLVADRLFLRPPEEEPHRQIRDGGP